MNYRTNDHFGFRVTAFDRRHIAFSLLFGEIVSHLSRSLAVKDFAVFIGNNKFARKSAEFFRRLVVDLKISRQNLSFKVRNFFEKTTRLAIILRIKKLKNLFVITSDKGKMFLS